MNKLIALTLATLSVTATAFAEPNACTPTTSRGTLCKATNGMWLRSCGNGTFIHPALPTGSCDVKDKSAYDANGFPILTSLSPTKKS